MSAFDLEDVNTHRPAKAATVRFKMSRPIHEIARECRRDWQKIYFGAVPYLDAMFSLSDIRESYGADSASSVVAYFLSNATTWRGEVARRCKAELNAMLKAAR